MRINLAKRFFLLSLAGVMAVGVIAPLLTSEASASQPFRPGNIISDAVMSNNQSMTASQIQQFLESKAPNCNGNQCLKNYREGGKSAAQIIHEHAQTHKINPQVFIVTLQKEVGLVTSTSPQAWMYRTAMGFGCPDSTPGVCDGQYFGFSNQIHHAGRFFRAHLNNSPGWFKPHIPGWNNILYHPHNNCGTQRVNIENRATASLYSYTPYVPNQAALNAGYGTGNNCSSYGNRNFHLFFNDWFGSPTAPILAVGWLNIDQEVEAGGTLSAWFWLRNDSKVTINLGNIKVIGRRVSDNANFDLPNMNNVSIRPGETITYRESRVVAEEGQYTFSLGRYAGGTWHSPAFSAFGTLVDTRISRTIVAPPSLVSDLSVTTPANDFRQNKAVTTNFTVKNNSDLYAVNIGRVKIAARDSRNANYDFASTPDLTLDPGQEYTYSQTRTFDRVDEYKLWVTNYRDDHGWSDTYPVGESSNTARDAAIQTKENVTVTSGLSVPSVIRQGDSVPATFVVKNHSELAVNIGRILVAARDSNNANYDFPSVPNLTLAPGQEYTYSQTRTFDRNGSYRFWVSNHRASHGWSDTYPLSEGGGLTRQRNSQVRDPVTITSNITTSANPAQRGQQVTGSFTIKNHSSRSVNVGRMKIAARDSRNMNYDFGNTPELTLAPGQEYTYSQTRTFDRADRYRLWISNHRASHGWSDTYPVSENTGTPRSINLTIN